MPQSSSGIPRQPDERPPVGEWTRCTPVLRFAYHAPPSPHTRRGWFVPAWYSCWWVRSGVARVRFDDGRRLQAQRDEWLLLPPHRPRHQFLRADTVLCSIAFSLEWPLGDPAADHLPLQTVGNAALRQAAEALLDELPGDDSHEARDRLDGPCDAARWLRINAALAGLVAQWSELAIDPSGSASPGDRRVRAAQRILADRPRMGAIDYADLHTVTGLGRVQLDRLFKQQLGRTPRAERDRHLMQAVLDALGEDRRSVAAIAADLGFTDDSHLCRWFRRQTGTTPDRYRRLGML